MDPFDEFEFKPLTNGLGFHKKAQALKEQMKKSGVVESELQSLPTNIPKSVTEEPIRARATTFDDVISSLEKASPKKQNIHDLEITETLPRVSKKAMEIEPARPIQSPFPKPEAFRQPFVPATPVSTEIKKVPTQANLNSVGTRRGAADSPKPNLQPTSTSISSAILDGIVVTALALVFVVALMVVTGVDLGMVVANMGGDILTQLSFALLFVAVMQMYVMISRSFYGRTLGEWTFDIQLGKDNEIVEEKYPLRVAMRSLLVTATGLVILPLLSLLTGKDLAGQLTGTQLYRSDI